MNHIIRSVLCILTILSVCSGTTLAESHYRAHTFVGFHGGATLSSMSFSPSITQKMLQGIMMGASFRYAEEKNFGLIGELNLVQRGWKEDFEETDFTYSRKFTYIQIPLLTHIYFGGRKWKGFVNLGPEVSYMISDKISSNFDYNNPEKVEGFPSHNRMLDQMKMEVSNKFDYGITAGAGVEFFVKPRHSLTLEGRYYFGIGNIFPSKKRDIFSASRGSAILISLGYNFRLR